MIRAPTAGTTDAHGGASRSADASWTSLWRRLLASLRRVTTSGAYIAEIDGLRFLAIFGVIAFHTAGYWVDRAGRGFSPANTVDKNVASLIGLGYYGVHLFFVISGFVLAMPFCNSAFRGSPEVRLRTYFTRRITRLEPPYVITMLVYFFMMPLFGKGSLADLFPHLIASLLYVHNIVFNAGSVINNNAWSLELEVQFYLLMPILACLLRAPATIRRAVFAGSVLFFSLHDRWLPPHFPVTILQYAQFFLCGILLCDLWTTRLQRTSKTRLFDVLGAASAVSFAWLNLSWWDSLTTDVLNPWLLMGFMASALRGRRLSSILSLGVLTTIGGMCYTIYLLHARVIAAVIHGLLVRMPSTGAFMSDYLIVLGGCSAAIFAVSTVFFLLVEKPCMNPHWPSDLRRAFSRTLPRAGERPLSHQPRRGNDGHR